MNTLKSLIVASVLILVSLNAQAFDSGDQVYYLHGEHNSSLNISKARVVSSNGSQLLAKNTRTGQHIRLSTTSVFPTWQDAKLRRDELDAAHISTGEFAGGATVLALYGLCRMAGAC